MAEPTERDRATAMALVSKHFPEPVSDPYLKASVWANDIAQALADERARIVAWLRSQDWDRMGILHEAADALEADHE